jgi:hypothetical protein
MVNLLLMDHVSKEQKAYLNWAGIN